VKANSRGQETVAAALRGKSPAEVASIVAAIVRDQVEALSFAECFKLWEDEGFHLLPVHFYSPVPDSRSLPSSLWEGKSELPGIDLNVDFQLQLVREVFPRFRAEYDQIPLSPTGARHEFYVENTMFAGTDAYVLYCMIRNFRPRLVLEIGSGFSSRLAAKAALVNGDTELVCVEPYPDEGLVAGFPGLTSLIRSNAQQLGLDFFEQLHENDILFIDSSHVVRCGSDVNYLLLEVVPRLAPGVIVHVHDVFLPYEYPEEWVRGEVRFWSEQYLLQAFLVFNSAFEVVLANNYLGMHHYEDLRAAFPKGEWCGGGSFWMRRCAGTPR